MRRVERSRARDVYASSNGNSLCAPKEEKYGILTNEVLSSLLASLFVIFVNSRDETIDGNRCDGKVFFGRKQRKVFAKSAYRRSCMVGWMDLGRHSLHVLGM